MEPEELKLVEEEDDRIVRFSFFAQMFSKLPMDLPEGLEISVVDDYGNVIASVKTDRFGKFNYQELPLQDQYLLKIVEDDPNYELKIVSKDGNLIGVLKRNNKGEFVFNREILYQEVAEVDKQKTTNETPVKSKPTNLPTSGSFNPIISFGFDGYKLNDNIRENLDHVVNAMNKEKAIKLEINSHTDSRGPAEYNMWLSQKRGENVKLYLTNKGISADRVVVNSWGETKLLNECSDDVNCTNEQHALNRRVELKYIR
jgi:outer membrane protein OmpA-like peptidoglycan-associated protein